MLKQIVYTLTEFPDIDNVEVRLNGESLRSASSSRTTTLTRRLFDDAGSRRRTTRRGCAGSTEPTGKGKALRVPEVIVDGSFVMFKGETNAKRGKIIVQLWQDNRLLRSLEDDAPSTTRPTRTVPIRAHSSTAQIEIPWGVAGNVEFRLTLQPDVADDEAAKRVDRPRGAKAWNVRRSLIRRPPRSPSRRCSRRAAAAATATSGQRDERRHRGARAGAVTSTGAAPTAPATTVEARRTT